MKVKDILKKKDTTVHCISPRKTIKEAIHMLVEHNIGSLLVTDNEKTVGIISERDILRVCNSDVTTVGSEPVESFMTKDVIIGTPDDDIDAVMSVMTEKKIRHLPILDGQKIVGMISIGDVVKSQLHESEHHVHYLRDYIMGA